MTFFWSLVVSAFAFEFAWFWYLTRRTEELRQHEQEFKIFLLDEADKMAEVIAKEIERSHATSSSKVRRSPTRH